MDVTELTRDQLAELKQSYLIELDDEGTLKEIADMDCVSWGDLANADEIVPDYVVFHHYDGVLFSEDDFSCTAGMER